MDELDVITKRLEQQRKDLEKLMDSTASRSGETAELLTRIEDLHRRATDVQQRFTTVGEDEPKK
jgi:ABC-type transporter Mla subunit MlaD